MAQKKIIAIYPGSFDPITLGHLDILKRAASLFDKVIMAVAINSEKKPMFSNKTRIKMIKEVIQDEGLSNIDVDSFNELLMNYANKKK